jgi:methyl-accepting chemotaxis protein
MQTRRTGTVDPTTGMTESQAYAAARDVFVLLAKRRPSYTTIRLLDVSGQELLRVDSDGTNVNVMPSDQLEDWSKEPFFQNALHLDDGQAYISRLDLYREHGEIVKPYRPTLRFSVPVYDRSNNVQGVLAIGINASNLLSQMSSAARGMTYVVDDQGYYLQGPDPSRNFGFELGTNDRLDDLYPSVAAALRAGGDDTVEQAVTLRNGQAALVLAVRAYFDPLDPTRFWGIVREIPDAVAFESAYAVRNTMIWIGIAVLLVAVVGGILVGRILSRRVSGLAAAAEKVAGGDLEQKVPDGGSDELGVLSRAFNKMVVNLADLIAGQEASRRRLERILQTVKETGADLGSGSSEILASTTQIASGAQEQSAAVSETVATVEQVMQVSDQASEKAKTVEISSRRALDMGEQGRQAYGDVLEAMGQVREQASAIAREIVALADRAQSIGEIIATVNDIAEQTNLLALNAGIEASRAGEHGAGFAYVAREIKELADESKRSTAQIRQILGEIQKATNSAVMTTEQGARSVAETISSVERSSGVIDTLVDSINEFAEIAAQIAASAAQQASGMSQIRHAMKDVNTVTTQNVAATRQTEEAARNLNRLGVRLNELLEEA